MIFLVFFGVQFEYTYTYQLQKRPPKKLELQTINKQSNNTNNKQTNNKQSNNTHNQTIQTITNRQSNNQTIQTIKQYKQKQTIDKHPTDDRSCQSKRYATALKRYILRLDNQTKNQTIQTISKQTINNQTI